MSTICFLAAALLIQATQAQEEVRVSSHPYVPQYALRVDTRLVEIAAVVRDGHGKVITGLTKDDFHILDDGKERVIDHFVADAGAAPAVAELKPGSAPEALKVSAPAASDRPPRFLALFIDDVNAKDLTNAGDLKRTQVAAGKFIKEALKGDVRIGIFTASGTPNLDFSTDEPKLLEAIAALKPHMKLSEDGLSSYCPWVPPYLAYRIAYENDRRAMRMVLADAAWKNKQFNNCQVPSPDVVRGLAETTWQKMKDITAATLSAVGLVVDHLAAMPGRRELLMASSGFIGASMQAQKDKVIDRALRAGVVISGLDSKGLFLEASADILRTSQYTGGYETTELPYRVQAMNEPMANLAEATGGVFYQNNNDLAAAFRKLGDLPEVTYRLSFRPEGVALDGGYHKLKVTAKGHTVQARPGYFAPSEKPAAESLQEKIDREVGAQDTVADFPVGIAVQTDRAGLSVIVSVDISKLRFASQGDRQLQKIAFVSALIDEQGKIAAAKESTMELALTEETYQRLKSSGVNAKVTLHVPAGAYRLRQVTEDGVDGKMACSSRPVEVR